MVVLGILKEELQNSVQAKRDYERAMKKLPRGSLVRKRIRDRDYYYLAYRDKGRVRFDYKGKLSGDEIKKYRDAMEYRARYRKHISELNKQIKFIRRILRAGETA